MDREKRELANIHSNDIADSVDAGKIQSLIYVIRGKQVMLDSDLAMLYQVETKRLNESVKRNIARFPDRYCFRLTKEEDDIKFRKCIWWKKKTTVCFY